MIEPVNPAAAIAVFVGFDFDSFAGFLPDTFRTDVASAVGDSVAEGYAAGYNVPLWMTMHEIEPGIRMTALYVLSEDSEVESDMAQTPVAWIERPIVPGDVADLLGTSGCHHPERAQHLESWPERGLCVRYSRRSGLPTLLFGFAPMTAAEFDNSPMAGHD